MELALADSFDRGDYFFYRDDFLFADNTRKEFERQMGILADDRVAGPGAYSGSSFSASRNCNSDWLGNTGTMVLCVAWFLGRSQSGCDTELIHGNKLILLTDLH
jgi:hypothetical protein